MTILKLTKIFFVIVLLLLVTAFGIAFAMLEKQPIAITQGYQQVDDADSVNALLGQLRYITRQRYSPQEVSMSYPQINSLLGFVQRALPEFSGELVMQENAASLRTTYQIKFAGLTRYINLQGQLESAKGVKLSEVKIGQVPVPGNWVMALIKTAINLRSNSNLGDLAVMQVSEVEIKTDAISVSLVPIHDFLVKLNQIKNGLSGGDNEALRLRIVYYLAFLAELDIPQDKPGLSLVDFIGPLFQRAQERNIGSSPEVQNEAALLALAIYTGHHRLANFIGEVQPIPGKVVLPRYRPMLSQRSDLTQHFVISAAIKILSQQGISSAIGEFKELMDRAEGGSGFSFADLAADMAGVKLAVAALSPNSALKVQSSLASATSESVFFASIEGLPEGVSKEQFASQYQHVNSKAYLAMLQLINGRLDALSLYQAN